MLFQTTNRLWHSPTYSWWRLPLKSLARLGITVSAVLIGILLPGMARMFREGLGALAATLLIWIGEWLFLLYGVHFTSFNALYGALGGIMAFLLWIFLSSCVCVFGICFCAALAEVRAKANGPCFCDIKSEIFY